MNFKITLNEVLFYLALWLQITASFFKQTQVVLAFPVLSPVLTGLSVLALLILLFKVIYDFIYDVKKLLFSLAIGAALILSAIVSRNVLLPLTLFAFWFTIQNVPFRRVIVVSFSVLVFYMLIIHLIYLSGEFQLNHDYRAGGQVRHALGYLFVTFASNYLFHLLLMWWFVREKRLTWIEIAMMSALVVYVYRLTDTRSALLFSFLAIFVFVVVKLFPKWEFLFIRQLILKYGLMIIGSIPIVLSYLYNPNSGWMLRINNLFTDRLRLGKVATQMFGIKPFGQSIEWTFYGDLPRTYPNGETYNYFYVDSSFLNVLLNYGFILLLFIFIGYYLLAKIPYFNNKYFVFVILIVGLHSMFDPQLVEIQYNPFILALGYTMSPIKTKLFDGIEMLHMKKRQKN